MERELAIAREERDPLNTQPRTLRNSRSKVRHDRQAMSQHAFQRLCQQLNVTMSRY
jgi:hypothetical protein